MKRHDIPTFTAACAIAVILTACGSSGDHSVPGDGAAGSGDGTGGSGASSTGGASSGGSTSHAGTTGAGGATGTGGGQSGTGGASGAKGSGGGNTTGAGGGSSGSGGSTTGKGGSTGTAGASGTGGATNPMITTHCTSALPAGAKAADVSKPTVVGTGTAASCTYAALKDAVTKAGVITFDCGTAPVTIAVTATLSLSTKTDTVIDGGNLVTLDGGNAVQILNYNSGNWMALETRVTLQHLTLINAKTTPTKAIPTAPAPCSQGFDDGEGGALYMRDGNLTVVDCTFSNNQAAELGPDTGGGAIYITGSKHGAIIVGSVFTGNSAANAGAVGGLFAELDIYDSLFENNTASGHGANNDDASMCSVMNNGQHEVGSGGNGAAIYQDGASATNVVLCGDDIEDNKAGMGGFGGGVFMTSNDYSGTMTVRDTTVTGNTGGAWTHVQQGNVNLGSAFGVNAKSATVENSTLQGQ
ncbi:MAG TPA: hypothetical protein VH062_32985 [Polyangiaceae bacterium]|jgi:hypothetical protein|nr:hypothetical protein [Polyangiaceae bacterium]